MKALYSLFAALCCFTFSMLTAPLVDAQARNHGAENEFPTVMQLNWLNRQFLDRQRTLADDLVRINLGQRIHTDKSDLELLQRLVDAEAIDSDDKQALQALGVVLGDIYTEERKELQWRVYEDDLGKSHAVCVVGTKNCLFPITMLSRRIEAGLQPDVVEVYQKGLEELKPYLPKRPFLDD